MRQKYLVIVPKCCETMQKDKKKRIVNAFHELNLSHPNTNGQWRNKGTLMIILVKTVFFLHNTEKLEKLKIIFFSLYAIQKEMEKLNSACIFNCFTPPDKNTANQLFSCMYLCAL